MPYTVPPPFGSFIDDATPFLPPTADPNAPPVAPFLPPASVSGPLAVVPPGAMPFAAPASAPASPLAFAPPADDTSMSPDHPAMHGFTMAHHDYQLPPVPPPPPITPAPTRDFGAEASGAGHAALISGLVGLLLGGGRGALAAGTGAANGYAAGANHAGDQAMQEYQANQQAGQAQYGDALRGYDAQMQQVEAQRQIDSGNDTNDFRARAQELDARQTADALAAKARQEGATQDDKDRAFAATITDPGALKSFIAAHPNVATSFGTDASGNPVVMNTAATDRTQADATRSYLTWANGQQARIRQAAINSQDTASQAHFAIDENKKGQALADEAGIPFTPLAVPGVKTGPGAYSPKFALPADVQNTIQKTTDAEKHQTATEAEIARHNRQMEGETASYHAGTLSLGAQHVAIAAGNLGLAQERFKSAIAHTTANGDPEAAAYLKSQAARRSGLQAQLNKIGADDQQMMMKYPNWQSGKDADRPPTIREAFRTNAAAASDLRNQIGAIDSDVDRYLPPSNTSFLPPGGVAPVTLPAGAFPNFRPIAPAAPHTRQPRDPKGRFNGPPASPARPSVADYHSSF